MHPAPATMGITTPPRARAVRPGRALIALLLLVAFTLALAPTAAYAATDLVRLNGDVTVGAGQTYKSVVVMNGTIVIDGRVENDAFTANGDIIVHDGGSIEGDAVSLTGKVISEGNGAIAGDRVEVGSEITRSNGVSIPEAPVTVSGRQSAVGGVIAWIVLTLGALGLGLFLVLISGSSLRVVGREISERLGRTILVGFLSLVGVPMVFVVLLISVIGTPVALLMIALVPLLSLYGLFALALVVGERLLTMFDRPQAKDVWAMVAGVLLIGVIRLIPVLGWIAFAVAALAGFGATVSRLWDYFQGRRSVRSRPGQTVPPYPMDPYPAGPYAPAGAYTPGAYAPAEPEMPAAPDASTVMPEPPAAPQSEASVTSEPRFHI